MSGGIPAATSVPAPVSKPAPKTEDLPPWEEERPPLPPEPEEKPTPQPPVQEKRPISPAPPVQEETPCAPVTTGDFWPAFSAGLKGLVLPSAHPFLMNPAVSGVWTNGVLTLWVPDEFTKSMLNQPNITEPMAKAAAARFGQSTRVVFSIGKAPEQVPAPAPQPTPEADALDQLLDFGSKFDNIVIE